MAELIIANAFVVTMNPERHMIGDGAIAIDGNRIVDVGPTQQVLAKHKSRQVIDASGMLAMPGLIDGHNHPTMYLSNGIGDDYNILDWLHKRVYPYEACLTPEEAYLSSLGAFVEGIKCGTTCVNEPGGVLPDSMIQAAADIGIRGIFNRSTRDVSPAAHPVPENQREDLETNLRRAEAVFQRWRNSEGGRIRTWFSLRTMWTVSADLCRGIKSLAERYRVGIHAHASTLVVENKMMVQREGKRSLQWLHDLGLFGPNLYLVHMGDTNDDEVRLLKKFDVKVCHCPSASMLGGYGVIVQKAIPKMVQGGVTVSLGTDNATSGGHLDMIRVMYLAACAHKDAYVDASIMGAHKALEMATIDGARACLWDDEIGSLESGKLADIALVKMEGIEWHVGRHHVNNLVYSATGRNVDTVIIDGRVIMRNRVLLTVDEHRLRKQLAEANTAWRTRSNFVDPPKWPVVN